MWYLSFEYMFDAVMPGCVIWIQKLELYAYWFFVVWGGFSLVFGSLISTEAEMRRKMDQPFYVPITYHYILSKWKLILLGIIIIPFIMLSNWIICNSV